MRHRISKLAFLSLTALCFLSSFAFSQEAEKTVKAIDVKGNKTISTLTILAKVKTQVNVPLSSTVLNEDLKRLYGLGYFTDVRIEQEDYDGGVKVVFHVAEKSVLKEIRIEGNGKIHKDQIKKEMQSVIGDFVDQKRVRDDVEAVRRLYEKKGFSEARVESSLDADPDTNQAVLSVRINEGTKVRIRDIRVTGNDSIKAGDILKKIKTKKMSWWGWLHSGFLKEEELLEDVERIKALYDEAGFSDAEVTTDTEPFDPQHKESGDIILKLILKEGKKYVVGDIQIEGNKIASTDEILKVTQMTKGRPFSRRGLRLDVGSIQDLYFDKGYLSARIRSESIYNEASDRVDLHYSIVENELTYVDKVRVQGNFKTKDVVIRRELRAYPGESFSGAKLKRSKERLYNLGFFEEVRFDTESGSTPNSRDLVVTVKEAKTGEFSFGGGFSSVDSVIGFAQIRQKNFDWQNTRTFTGAGQDFGLRLEVGSVRRNGEISFTEPWVFGYPYSFGFDLYRREINNSRSAGFFYDLRRTGGDLRLGKEFTEYDKGLLMYRLEEVRFSDIPDTSSQALKDELGSNVISSAALSLTHDQRDNVFNPSKGFLAAGTGEIAGGPLGGDKDFMKLFGSASTYLKHFERLVLELKVRAGIADAYGDSTTVPLYERYFAGGANTIRGYKERRIGPRDPGNGDPVGGEAYWVGNIEETFPIYPDLVKGAVFFDTGDVYEKIDKFGSGDGPFSGFGVGVRIKTPIGPVKLDAGYPIDDVPGESKKVRFYFNISQGF
ncbi:MAG: outer membrane protein assembly factor BamA [Candidatus Omnitrophica bacterium]|nr:outer membrane protein assembly factor BamA [Candidatus Omnitrophota bacterium]